MSPPLTLNIPLPSPILPFISANKLHIRKSYMNLHEKQTDNFKARLRRGGVD